jgi:hypothetical protein
MGKIDIVLFQAGVCDSCDVTWAILQSISGIVNGTVGEDVINLKRFTLGEEEGREAALKMGVKAGPTYFINGERHEGKLNGDEIFNSIASKLDIDKDQLESLKKAYLG